MLDYVSETHECPIIVLSWLFSWNPGDLQNLSLFDRRMDGSFPPKPYDWAGTYADQFMLDP